MFDFGIEPWHLWVMLGIILLTLEVFVAGFVLASLSVGAFAAAVFHGVTDDFGWALGGFVVGAAAGFFGLRPFLDRTVMDQKPSEFGTEGMKGQTVTIIGADQAGGAPGAQFRDSTWKIESSDELAAGDKAVIVDVKGATLVVSRINEE